MDSIRNLGSTFADMTAAPPTKEELARMEFAVPTPAATTEPDALPQKSPSFVHSCEPMKEKGYASDCIGLSDYDGAYDTRRRGSKRSFWEFCQLLMCQRPEMQCNMERQPGGVLA